MSACTHAPVPRVADRKWGFLIVGGSLVGAAACFQFTTAGPDEYVLARFPESVAAWYRAGGKLAVTVPLALLGAAMMVLNLTANRRARAGGAAGAPPAPRRKTPSRAAFLMPATPPPLPELPIAEEAPDEPLAEAEELPPEPQLRIPALPGRFEGRVSSDHGERPAPAEPAQTPSSRRGRGTKSSAEVELVSAKYLNRDKRGGRNSSQGG